MPLETIIAGDTNIYDVLIIGAGPSGLSAAIFLARANLKVGFIEKNIPGGQVVNIPKVYNYPGFNEISGSDLALNMYQQAINLKAQYIYGEVVNITKKLGYMIVYTSDGNIRYAKVIVVSTGVGHTKLNIVGEEEYLNKGVSYCATCDGALAKDENIAIVGNTHEAIEALDYLSNIAQKIYFISNLDITNPHIKNVQQFKNYKIEKINGNDYVSSIDIKSFNDVKSLEVSYVFVFNGSQPAISFLPREVVVKNGTIVVDENMQTSMKEIFAIGDVIRINNRQIINAVSDGSIASSKIINFVRNEFEG